METLHVRRFIKIGNELVPPPIRFKFRGKGVGRLYKPKFQNCDTDLQVGLNFR